MEVADSDRLKCNGKQLCILDSLQVTVRFFDWCQKCTMPIVSRPTDSHIRDKVPVCSDDRADSIASLAGKTIVFVSPGYPGKRFIFDKAFELGVNVVVIDGPGSWTNDLVDSGIIKTVVSTDMSVNEDEIFTACVSELSKLPSIDGICTFVELSAPLTARLCERFQVPGHTPLAVSLARDKHLTRKAIQSTVTTSQYAIRNCLIRNGSRQELLNAAERVGFPAVLKPVSGAASLGVQKVTSLEDLFATYEVVRSLVSELIVSSGALERKVRMEADEPTEKFHTNVSSLSNTAIVLEEYIEGQEVDIDIILSSGEMTFCEISDNGPTVEPYFGETHNCCPSLLSDEDQSALRTMAHVITADALGFTSGVFHVEGKMSPHGPRLIEVNCRMGGGPIRAVHLTRSGVDLVVEQMLLAVGFPSKPVFSESDRPAVGFIDVNASKSGTVHSLQFMERFNDREGMIYCKPYVSVGEHIVGPEEGQPSWLAEAVFTRSSAKAASDDAESMYTEIQKLFESHYV